MQRRTFLERGVTVGALALGGFSLDSRAIAADVPGNTAYASSKLGVARAVRRRATAWGEAGVRLNAVAPGPFASALLDASRADPTLGPLVDLVPIPLGRPGGADDDQDERVQTVRSWTQVAGRINGQRDHSQPPAQSFGRRHLFQHQQQ